MRQIIFTISIVGIILAGCTRSADTGRGSALDWQDDWDKAVKIAKKDGRNLIAEFSTEWCTYCRFMEERIFTDAAVAENMKKFALVRLDCDRPEMQGLMDKHGVTGFPTFIIFDPKGKEILRFNDANDSAEMIAYLAKVLGSSDDKADAEKKLSDLLEAAKDNFEDGIKYGKQLIREFPDSPYLPYYYKKLAEFYKSESVKKKYLNAARVILEKRMLSPLEMDFRTMRITLDQQIELLAGIYEKLDPGKVCDAYLRGARACEEMVRKFGGIRNNSFAIGTIAYYYTSAGKPGDAARFLEGAMGELPDYWPVYSNYAKALAAQGDFSRAIEYAKKGYDLAEDVAKPKVAIVWADAYAADMQYGKAIEVLDAAREDLVKTGSTKSGRAAKTLSYLDQAIKEYSSEMSTH